MKFGSVSSGCWHWLELNGQTDKAGAKWQRAGSERAPLHWHVQGRQCHCLCISAFRSRGPFSASLDSHLGGKPTGPCPWTLVTLSFLSRALRSQGSSSVPGEDFTILLQAFILSGLPLHFSPSNPDMQHPSLCWVGSCWCHLRGLPVSVSRFTEETGCRVNWCFGHDQHFRTSRVGFWGAAGFLPGSVWIISEKRYVAALKARRTLPPRVGRAVRAVVSWTDRRTDSLFPGKTFASLLNFSCCHWRCCWWQSLHVSPQSPQCVPSSLLLTVPR